MKMNAFLRLIRAIACSVLVFSSSGVYGQIDDGNATYGSLQPADENGNPIYQPPAETASPVAGQDRQEPARTFTQVPEQTVEGIPLSADVPVDDSMYPVPAYPPGVEIPLTEIEIPGSAWYVGPDGERIDASQLIELAPVGPLNEAPVEGSVPLYSGQGFSVEGTYDGTQTFPMGTFPTTPFGERILSEVPAGGSVANEIPGAWVDENGNLVDAVPGGSPAADSPATENGVPVDQIVRPGNTDPVSPSVPTGTATPASDSLAVPKSVRQNGGSATGGRVAPKTARSVVEKVRSMPRQDTTKVADRKKRGSVDASGDTSTDITTAPRSSVGRSKAEESRVAAAPSEEAKPLRQRHARIKQRLKDALGEKEKIGGMLRKSNRKADTLAAELAQLKAAHKNLQTQTNEKIKSLEGQLTEARTGQTQKMKKVKALQAAQKEATQKMETLTAAQTKALKKLQAVQQDAAAMKAALESELAEAQANVADAQSKLADANAQLAVLTAPHKQMAAKENADLSGSDKSQMPDAPGGNEAVAKPATDARLANPGQVASGADATPYAPAMEAVQPDAVDPKSAAELAVKRKLEALRKEKEAAEAALDAKAQEAAGAAGANGDNSAKMPVLSLDDQIKQLKVLRDKQIAKSETKLRSDQQKVIDKLIDDGKAVDSDEVKAAVDKMKQSIKTSEEKLRARFRRKLERLKAQMKKKLK